MCLSAYQFIRVDPINQYSSQKSLELPSGDPATIVSRLLQDHLKIKPRSGQDQELCLV